MLLRQYFTRLAQFRQSRCFCNLRTQSQIGLLTRNIASSYNHMSPTYSSDKLLGSVRRCSTVSQSEVQKFGRLAPDWWNEEGKMAALHSLNTLRVPLIKNGLLNHSDLVTATPLAGFKLLDVGCGAGILSEPLARLGAYVTGVDASPENIEVAKRHAELDEKLVERLHYICTSVEELKSSEPTTLYDAVIMSEVVEHVDNIEMFLETCCSLVKPGGSVFITTINRTISSYLLAIVAGEKLLRVVPDGSHEWHKFIQPSELQHSLAKYSFSTRLIHGMLLNPVTGSWMWCRSTDCNYALHAVKTAESSSNASTKNKSN